MNEIAFPIAFLALIEILVIANPYDFARANDLSHSFLLPISIRFFWAARSGYGLA